MAEINKPVENKVCIIAPIEVDEQGNAHCNNIVMPHRFVEYEGCQCSISRYMENKGENAGLFPFFCLCPDTIDISYTGVVEKAEDGKAHVGKFVFSDRFSKDALQSLLGKTIIVSKIRPIIKKDSEYKGKILRYKVFQDDVQGKKIKTDKSIYYLIDTNAFIDCPDILDRIDNTNHVLIVNQVIFELDGLKKSSDKEISQAAKQSTVNILNVSGYDEVVFVRTKEPYEPFESPCSMDQKILAAAFLKGLQEKRILLVSSDNNMRLTAKAYDIPSQSLEDFLGGKVVKIKRKKSVNWLKVLKSVGVLVLGVVVGFGIGRATKRPEPQIPQL